MSGHHHLSSPSERPGQHVARACIECLDSAEMARICERVSPYEAFQAIAKRLKRDEAFGSNVLLVKATGTRTATQLRASSDAAPDDGHISAWPLWFHHAEDDFDMPLLYLLRSDSVAQLRAAMGESVDRAILFNDAETVKSRWPKGVQPGVPLWLAGSPDSFPYDPASGAEALSILRSAMQALYVDDRPGYFYFTLHNDTSDGPAVPLANLEHASKGMYRVVHAPPSNRGFIRLLGAGQALSRVMLAADVLRNHWGVDSEIWSCPSYTCLAREGYAAERWNTLHPAAMKRTSHIEACLGANRNPVLAITGYAQHIAGQIGGFVASRFVAMGSDSHPGPPGCPDVDWIVAVALSVLGGEGMVPPHWAYQALQRRDAGSRA